MVAFKFSSFGVTVKLLGLCGAADRGGSPTVIPVTKDPSRSVVSAGLEKVKRTTAKKTQRKS